MGAAASFAKHVAFSLAARGVALFSGLAFTYFVANALGPEDYGLVVFFVNFVVGLLALAGFKVFYDVAAVFTGRHKSAPFFWGLLRAQFLASLAVLGLVLFFSDKVVAWLGKGNASLLAVTAVLLVLQPFYENFLRALKAFKRFGKVFYTVLLQNAVNLAVALVLVVLLQRGLMGVLHAKILSLFLAVLLMAFFLWRLAWTRARVSRAEVWRYLKGIVPENWLLAVRDQPLVWVQGFFLPAQVLGLYFIAQKIFAYALGNVAAALAEVLLPYNLERYRSPAALARYTSLTIKFLVLLALAAGAALLALGPVVLGLLFPAFRDAYALFPLLWLAFLARTAGPLVSVFKALNATEELAKGTLFSLAVTLPAAVLLTWQWGVTGFILAEALSGASKNAFLWWRLRGLGVRVDLVPRAEDARYFAAQAAAALARAAARLRGWGSVLRRERGER